MSDSQLDAFKAAGKHIERNKFEPSVHQMNMLNRMKFAHANGKKMTFVFKHANQSGKLWLDREFKKWVKEYDANERKTDTI